MIIILRVKNFVNNNIFKKSLLAVVDNFFYKFEFVHKFSYS
jgi:hypothetical protein